MKEEFKEKFFNGDIGWEEGEEMFDWLSTRTIPRDEVKRKLEGMRKKHREFECNGAHGGKGCYETWCDMETCTSKDALECKAQNKIIADLLSAFNLNDDEN